MILPDDPEAALALAAWHRQSAQLLEDHAASIRHEARLRRRRALDLARAGRTAAEYLAEGMDEERAVALTAGLLRLDRAAVSMALNKFKQRIKSIKVLSTEERVFGYKNSGLSIRQIASKLNIPKSTVHDIFRRRR